MSSFFWLTFGKKYFVFLSRLASMLAKSVDLTSHNFRHGCQKSQNWMNCLTTNNLYLRPPAFEHWALTYSLIPHHCAMHVTPPPPTCLPLCLTPSHPLIANHQSYISATILYYHCFIVTLYHGASGRKQQNATCPLLSRRYPCRRRRSYS